MSSLEEKSTPASDVEEQSAAARKWGEAAAVRRYIQETSDVISYLREPLKSMPPEAAFVRAGAVAMLEALTIFNDVMQHNPDWPELVVPEPELIAAARGVKIPGSLRARLEVWRREIGRLAHRDYWLKDAFEANATGVERDYFRVLDRSESAMVLLYEEGLGHRGMELMQRVNEAPISLNILEFVKDLQVRDFL